MWRHVRALGHVAHVAQVALVDNFPIALRRHAVQLAGRTLIDEIEKPRKGGTQVHAAPAAVADIEDSPELLLDAGVIVELRRLPVERMPGGSLEAPFTGGHSEP